MNKVLTALILLLAPLLTHANKLSLGAPLPEVEITDRGFLQLKEGELTYRDWSSIELKNKVILIQHIAGRMSAKELNEPMIDAIKAANFPHEKYNTATLVNLDDAIWGTGAIVASQLKSNKEEFPMAIFVVDEEGDIRDRWGLTPESSAVIVLDRSGNVLFVKDGELDNTDINSVLNIIKANI